MAIKEISTNYQTYYKAMQYVVKPKHDNAVEEYEKLLAEENALYTETKELFETYVKTYRFNPNDYSEYRHNEYTKAKALFMNKRLNYTAKTALYKLYKLARLQKDLYNLKVNIHRWEKMLDLTITQYKQILETFYNEVMRQMIVDGVGYVLENPLGWICINRCKIEGNRKVLDYKATKENKARLLAEGKRLWNKDEAAYAAKVGAKYNGVDYRVYLESENCYEIPLIGCRLPNGKDYTFKTAFARRHVTGKTEEQVIEECHNDVNEVCKLTADIRYKLKLCLKIDNLLYLNFIRNDAQQSAHTPKANRKS